MASESNTPTTETPFTHDTYRLGCICSSIEELLVATSILDERHEALPQPIWDSNVYSLGSIGGHNVVIASHHKAPTGHENAVTTLLYMSLAFPKLKVALLVGPKARVPFLTERGAIRQEHVVVNQPTESHPGSLQFFHRNELSNQVYMEYEGMFRPPITLLNTAREVAIRRLRVDLIPMWKDMGLLQVSFQQFRPHKFQSNLCANYCLGDLQYVIHRGEALLHGLEDNLKEWRSWSRLKRLVENHYAVGVQIYDSQDKDTIMLILIRGIFDYDDSHQTWNRFHGFVATAMAAWANHLQLTTSPTNAPQRKVHEVIEGGFHNSTEYDSRSSVEYDVHSDVSSVFSTESDLVSSQSSQSEMVSIAIDPLAHLLLYGTELKLLYPTAMERVGPDMFQRGFGRMLRKYGRNLHDEATSELQHRAALFVRQNARSTAARMRMALMGQSGGMSFERKRELAQVKSARVKAWMESQGGSRIEFDAGTSAELEEDDSSSDGSLDDLTENEHNTLSTLRGVMEFMLSARAFSTLRQDLREWLEVKQENDLISEVEVTHQDLPEAPGEVSSSKVDSIQGDLDRRLVDSSQINLANENAKDPISAVNKRPHDLSMDEPSPVAPEARSKEYSWVSSLWPRSMNHNASPSHLVTYENLSPDASQWSRCEPLLCRPTLSLRTLSIIIVAETLLFFSYSPAMYVFGKVFHAIRESLGIEPFIFPIEAMATLALAPIPLVMVYLSAQHFEDEDERWRGRITPSKFRSFFNRVWARWMRHGGLGEYTGNLFFPPKPGYHRIPYQCGCGEMSYLDVRELSDGGIERFKQRLFRSIAAASARSHSANTPTSNIQPPCQAHLSPSSGPSIHVPSPNSTTANPGQPPSPPQSIQSGQNHVSVAGIQNHDSQFLLLCVGTNNSTTLVQIDVGSLTNDQYLFQQVYEEYRNIRDEHKFRLSRIIPLQIRRVFNAISAKSKNTRGLNFLNLPFLSRFMIPEFNIFKVSSGDFVRFSLVPIGMKSCPRWFKRGEIPPETEVRAGRYLYEPVPMEDVEIFDIPLNHLLKPGSHTDKFWIATFPKKIKDPLLRLAGNNGQVVGWGIRVNESLNWLAILPFILCVLVSTGVAVVVYAEVTSDDSSAFGLGAFLVALFTVYISYQYFAWQDQIS